MTTTVDVTYGEVAYKTGFDGTASTLQKGTTVTFRAISGAPQLTYPNPKPGAGDLKEWVEKLLTWMKQELSTASKVPCFGSASRPGHMTDGTFEIKAGEPVVVREFGKAGTYSDRVLMPGDVLQLDTIEENAITCALYGVEPA